jgi:uncharacterized protein YeeX (DUF496 family)
MESDWYVEGLNETPWLDVDDVVYNVGYSQGDYAYFTGRVLLDKFLEAKDTENDYFVLVEAMKLQDCSDQLLISSSHRGGHATFDDIEWWGKPEDYWHEGETVQGFRDNRSILEGMDYKEYHNLCQELIGDLYTWVKEVCEQRMNKLYWEIREDIDHQMSEESFEEWAESMDEQFEVEVDDDEPRDADHSEDARMAA